METMNKIFIEIEKSRGLGSGEQIWLPEISEVTNVK